MDVEVTMLQNVTIRKQDGSFRENEKQTVSLNGISLSGCSIEDVQNSS